MLYNQIEFEVIECEAWLDRQRSGLSIYPFSAKQVQERQDLQALPQSEPSSLLIKRFNLNTQAR
jgi:hypothetical protein